MFGWGIVFVVSGVGFLVFGVKIVLGVKDVRECVILFFLIYRWGWIWMYD